MPFANCGKWGGGGTERGTWQFQDARELATPMCKAEGLTKESWDHRKYSHAKVVRTNQISRGQREKGDQTRALAPSDTRPLGRGGGTSNKKEDEEAGAEESLRRRSGRETPCQEESCLSQLPRGAEGGGMGRHWRARREQFETKVGVKARLDGPRTRTNIDGVRRRP